MASSGSSNRLKDTSKAEPPSFTCYGSAPLYIDKLVGSNYDTRASDLKLWLNRQDYANHLAKKIETTLEIERSPWGTIDA